MKPNVEHAYGQIEGSRQTRGIKTNKGAVEQDQNKQGGNSGMNGQLHHPAPASRRRCRRTAKGGKQEAWSILHFGALGCSSTKGLRNPMLYRFDCAPAQVVEINSSRLS